VLFAGMTVMISLLGLFVIGSSSSAVSQSQERAACC
jgi:hypothetical protein